MKDIFKRILSRPIQMTSNVAVAICTYVLLPDSPNFNQWLAYGVIYASLLFYGYDSYTEGFERGLNVSNKLDGMS